MSAPVYRVSSSQSASSFSEGSSHSVQSSGQDPASGRDSHSHSHHHRHSREAKASTMAQSTGIIRNSQAWFQTKIHLRPALRGCHLITEEVLKSIPEIQEFSVGVCHIQILHTSASLTINENWDPDVREDMEMFLSRLIPESTPFRHSCEGPDDMPAHIKSCFLGSSLSVPITDGKLNLGSWQGIWLCEHRNRAGSRKIVVTLNGALKKP